MKVLNYGSLNVDYVYRFLRLGGKSGTLTESGKSVASSAKRNKQWV